MEKNRGVLWLLAILISVFSCKKAETEESQIEVQNVVVASVNHDAVEITFELSHFGYERAGVVFYRRSDPSNTQIVYAIRGAKSFKLVVQTLEAETDYGFKVFYQKNDQSMSESQPYFLTTLSEAAASFAIKVKDEIIETDEQGRYSIDLEGEALKEMNLNDFHMKVGISDATPNYPVLINGNRYRITVTGKVDPALRENMLAVTYKGELLMFKMFKFRSSGINYAVNANVTKIRGLGDLVVWNNKLYFFNGAVSTWDEDNDRVLNLGAFPGWIDIAFPALTYGDQIFLTCSDGALFPESGPIDFYKFPQLSSYAPKTGTWTRYQLNEQMYTNLNWQISGHYFKHMEQLYYSYSVTARDDSFTPIPINGEVFIYRYNSSSLKFDLYRTVVTDMIDSKFISVGNQLFQVGLSPLVDQGFIVNATLRINKVNENFKMEHFYTSGNLDKPENSPIGNLYALDGKILFARNLQDFKLFDLNQKVMHKVSTSVFRNEPYLGSIFVYNNKLHLMSNPNSSSQKIYEISIDAH